MKFSIITPVYNCEKYIAETIESVLSQGGDFEIEYFIVDGNSNDGTLEIVKQYKKLIDEGLCKINCNKINFKFLSELDYGMYDAIKKGFSSTNGEVMAYINADDKYVEGAFSAISEIFKKYPDIKWVKGVNTTSDDNSIITSHGSCFIYNRKWLKKGVYGRSAYVVHQDSVFWRRTLWNKAHPNIESFRLAGDYAMWVAFANEAPLWSLNKTVSIFRKRTGQLSDNILLYKAEQRKVLPPYFFLDKKIASFFYLIRYFRTKEGGIFSRILFSILFPLYKYGWYIDLDKENHPIIKKAYNFIV